MALKGQKWGEIITRYDLDTCTNFPDEKFKVYTYTLGGMYVVDMELSSKNCFTLFSFI